MIGAGAVGSFAALALTKVGVGSLTVYDGDGVTAHNIPNQFYRVADAEGSAFKVYALQDIIRTFNGVEINADNNEYSDQPLGDTVIVATDSMASRRLVWEQFLAQSQCLRYIEARMGGELGIVYAMQAKDGPLRTAYEELLFPDSKAADLPCTARSIIYNVMMIGSLICRAMKAMAKGEKNYPWEVIFDMTTMDYYERRA